MAISFDAHGLPTVDGKLVGKDKAGNPLTVDKKFNVDTGASLSGIDEANAAKFQLSEFKGAGKKTSAGGKALSVYEGLTMKFPRKTKSGTPPEAEAECPLRFAIIKHPPSILGMDQLKATGTDFVVSQKKRTGELKEDP